MGIMMDYVVPAIVGAVISIFMDEFVVPHIKVTLCSGQMLKSLEEMANAVKENSLQPEHSPFNTAIDEWYGKLRCLVHRANEMVEMVHRYRQVRRIQDRLNVFSHHQRSKNITNLISDIDRCLKLAPLIQLDLVLWQIVKKMRLKIADIQVAGLPPPPAPAAPPPAPPAYTLVIAGIVGWVITTVFQVIFFYIQTLLNFKKNLDSFEDLVKNIDPIIEESRDGIRQIQRAHNDASNRVGIRQIQRAHNDASNRVADASNRVANASNWLGRMNELLNQSPSSLGGSPIGSCRKSKKMTELTSEIYAHLNKLSLINLDLYAYLNKLSWINHETEGSTSHPPWPQQGDNGVSSDCDGPPWHNNGVCSDGDNGICVPGHGVCPHHHDCGRHDSCSVM